MSFSSDPSLLSNQLPISLDVPQDQQEFLNFSTLYFKRIANIINTKEGALYSRNEVANYQQYNISSVPVTYEAKPGEFINIYRKTFDAIAQSNPAVTSLPNNATITIPHGLTFDANLRFTRIFGCAIDPSHFSIPLPFVEPLGINFCIALYVDTNNIIIRTGSDRTNFTYCQVVLEYMKVSYR